MYQKEHNARHLKKGTTGRFAETIFYFLCRDPFSSSCDKVTRKRCNLGDGEGMQVPCRVNLTGEAKFVSFTSRID